VPAISLHLGDADLRINQKINYLVYNCNVAGDVVASAV